MTFTPAIVVIAYNRKRSLQRLLQGLSAATYSHTDIPLIISIDHAENNGTVLEVARAFPWRHGPKEVVYQPKNLGLRNHILQCGAYAEQYGAAILLEDDLYVSPNFYSYAVAALQFSEDKPYISGVSLYSHQFNVHSRQHFSPLLDGYDNWYFQFASSWGQAWTKTQWEAFYDWYVQQGTLKSHPLIPENVTHWSEKSWLKYFIAYLVATDRFFLYPRNSYTTNFSDPGTHVGKDSTTYQVPLDFGAQVHFNFSALENSNSIYDAFFENKNLHKSLSLETSALSVDLYGKKTILAQTQYILTDTLLPYQIVRGFGRSLKPHDANIVAGIAGEDLFLYDSHQPQPNPHRYNAYRKILYHIKSMNHREAITVLVQLLRERLGSALKKIGLWAF